MNKILFIMILLMGCAPGKKEITAQEVPTQADISDFIKSLKIWRKNLDKNPEVWKINGEEFSDGILNSLDENSKLIPEKVRQRRSIKVISVPDSQEIQKIKNDFPLFDHGVFSDFFTIAEMAVSSPQKFLNVSKIVDVFAFKNNEIYKIGWYIPNFPNTLKLDPAFLQYPKLFISFEPDRNVEWVEYSRCCAPVKHLISVIINWNDSGDYLQINTFDYFLIDTSKKIAASSSISLINNRLHLTTFSSISSRGGANDPPIGQIFPNIRSRNFPTYSEELTQQFIQERLSNNPSLQ